MKEGAFKEAVMQLKKPKRRSVPRWSIHSML